MHWPCGLYRCVLCWRVRPWDLGCADDLDVGLSAAVSQQAFSDGETLSDGGACDDCWHVLGEAVVQVLS
jgi:hypothetical protein